MQIFLMFIAAFFALYAILGNIWVYHQLVKMNVPVSRSQCRVGGLYGICLENSDIPKSIKLSALSTVIAFFLAFVFGLIAVSVG